MGRRARMRKLREDDLEELLEQEQSEPTAEKATAPKAPAAADKALELQKSAGNRAVGAALNRWSLPWVPQTAAPVAKWPKEPQVIFDGDLVVPLKSWNDAGRSPAGARGTGQQSQRGDAEGPGEIVIVTEMGDYVVDLHKATLAGKAYGKVEIIVPGPNGTGIRVELENVYIVSYQTGGDPYHGGGVQSYQLSFSKRKFSRAPPPPRR